MTGLRRVSDVSPGSQAGSWAAKTDMPAALLAPRNLFYLLRLVGLREEALRTAFSESTSARAALAH